jgi:hypothetical protein
MEPGTRCNWAIKNVGACAADSNQNWLPSEIVANRSKAIGLKAHAFLERDNSRIMMVACTWKGRYQ